MKIAVDFDGTIVEHRYPQIGEEKLFALTKVTPKRFLKQKITAARLMWICLLTTGM
jgi:hypothetical protein